MKPELLFSRIPDLSPEGAQKLIRYYEMLVDWNSRMNLTAITEAEEVAEKHFADSLLPAALIKQNAKLIDVGSGAGFPGIPLKILRPDLEVCLLDSLNKRIGFLKEVCSELGLEKLSCIHARAEDGGRMPELRGKFDVATSRAVARISVIAEWSIPFLKLGGTALMYKGPQAEEELLEAKRALTLLHGEATLHSYEVPWGDRRVVAVKKTAETPKAYPRKAGTAAKNPL